MNDPTLQARELVAQARALAHEAREEAHRLSFILARRAESRALLRMASASEAFATRLSTLTDFVEQARPLLPDDEL